MSTAKINPDESSGQLPSGSSRYWIGTLPRLMRLASITFCFGWPFGYGLLLFLYADCGTSKMGGMIYMVIFAPILGLVGGTLGWLLGASIALVANYLARVEN